MAHGKTIPRNWAVCTIFAVLLLSSSSFAQQGSTPPQQQQAARAPDPHASEELAAQRQALGFLQYLDQGRYPDSYAYTSRLIRAKLSQAQFGQEVQKARASLGAKQTRKLLNASYATSLPDAPSGQYVVLQYNTDFANKSNAVETLTLSFENGYWWVAGWYVR
ncbi:MAG TPA: DUF4019 domain-containing protein [Acidobacteriaceae bacterium]|nr:DUF4019 domain-containing protein [Acidobacteriaceae bacterium]